jgi:iodotyrosine deiodinase
MSLYEAVPLPDWQEMPVATMLGRGKAFLETMKKRHTVRDFSDRPVPRELIEIAIMAAATAPSGANHQPWHFTAIGSAEKKAELRRKAEIEERAFYDDRKAGEEWLDALKPLGTNAHKPYLETAPWIIAIFGQRKGGITQDAVQQNYYVPESVGIAMGFLISALHNSGLVTLTHTPKPMTFLNELCGRPASEKPYLLLVCGYPDENATVPVHALKKKSFEQVAHFI